MVQMEKRRPLSAIKVQAVRRFFSPEERIDHHADTGNLATFLNKPGGAIWRIFWLHIQHPKHFPIYDQHVHRAMAVLLKWPECKREIPAHNPTKVRTYLEDYRPFFGRFGGRDHRQVDRALWSFGRFLNSEYGGVMTPRSNRNESQP